MTMAKKETPPANMGIPEVLLAEGETPPQSVDQPTESPADATTQTGPETAPAEPPAEKPARLKFRRPRPECPRCQRAGRVTATRDYARYCVCDACGHDWKEIRHLEEDDPFLFAVKEFVESAQQVDTIPDPDDGKPCLPIPLDVFRALQHATAQQVQLKPVRRPQ